MLQPRLPVKKKNDHWLVTSGFITIRSLYCQSFLLTQICSKQVRAHQIRLNPFLIARTCLWAKSLGVLIPFIQLYSLTLRGYQPKKIQMPSPIQMKHPKNPWCFMRICTFSGPCNEGVSLWTGEVISNTRNTRKPYLEFASSGFTTRIQDYRDYWSLILAISYCILFQPCPLIFH